ncbi:hypothetical protein G3M58_36845 [Streptomyces sp. SID7499]|uniref:Uncharacterized protein n=1 Tax=Streptomyces sp. SID7499 TaxID=2706086 RepID=A0A6G3X2X1_9ACTN|nr:hypothetical protein [Streptomyces sp. SID7499]
MTRHLTHALAGLYALAAVVLLRCAMVSHSHGSWPYTLFFAGAAVLFAVAIGHHAYHRDELRAALLRLERAARPPGPHPAAVQDEITLAWHALGEACCLRQWETAGREHDPDRCARKDQTT